MQSVRTRTIQIKLHFQNPLEPTEATLWCRQDPKDLDRPMQAQKVEEMFYYIGEMSGQGSKDYKSPVLTARQSVLTQVPQK